MHPARLWKAMPDSGGKDPDRVQCLLCSQFCLIPSGGYGMCGVRINQDGQLMTLVYDRVAAVNVDPVEKKPLYHFLPSSLTFSLGTMGCNLSCSFCQNFSLSQPPRNGRAVAGRVMTPEDIVSQALATGCKSISYTYSEPTIFFELVQDTASLAQEQGLKNILVSNGFQSPDCLDSLGQLIDAANIDLKAFTPEFYRKRCGARLGPVKRTLEHIVSLGWWLEVTTLVIPGLNDTDEELMELSAFIAGKLGTQVPWHLSRFHPDHELRNRPPTPVATLEHAAGLGRAAGLQYVYIGNVPGHAANQTLCPACGSVAAARTGFSLADPFDGTCQACGHCLDGVFS